ncbi:MAG: ATP-binding protein [Deltaproteobacteria bacterium]|nr:ATP-binding protein [Deltaproteobacteria bacterium]
MVCRASYPIAGGDFERAGSASRELKAVLKRLGVAAQAVRRAIIAAYEAEMNTVIYARQGRMELRIEPGRIRIDVVDEGPGIEDIGQAMHEGFSTAPAHVRQMGFGAGMGLPNIERNADELVIRSEPGQGTRVRFRIDIPAEDSASAIRSALEIRAGRCKQCMRCLHACPTGALRVRPTGPRVLEHLCIDCAACIEACPSGALALEAAGEEARADRLIAPAALLAQFPGLGAGQVIEALGELGYGQVLVLEPWERALREAVAEMAAGAQRTIICPTCPAAVRLIELRFPSLLPQLAPFDSPVEAAASCQAEPFDLAVCCPAQRSAAERRGTETLARMRPVDDLQRALLPLLAKLPAGGAAERRCDETAPHARPADGGPQTTPAHRGAAERRCDETAPHTRPADGGPQTTPAHLGPAERRCDETAPHTRPADGGPLTTPAARPGWLEVTGMRHAIAVLEQLEDGLLGPFEVVEPLLCDLGCAGSPLFRQDAHLGAQGPELAGGLIDESAQASPCAPRKALPGLRLDADMAAAVDKLGRIDELARRLPGRDCAMCGAPSCALLAEDVVLGREDTGACPHLDTDEEGLP